MCPNYLAWSEIESVDPLGQYSYSVDVFGQPPRWVKSHCDWFRQRFDHRCYDSLDDDMGCRLVFTQSVPFSDIVNRLAPHNACGLTMADCESADYNQYPWNTFHMLFPPELYFTQWTGKSLYHVPWYASFAVYDAAVVCKLMHAS